MKTPILVASILLLASPVSAQSWQEWTQQNPTYPGGIPPSRPPVRSNPVEVPAPVPAVVSQPAAIPASSTSRDNFREIEAANLRRMQESQERLEREKSEQRYHRYYVRPNYSPSVRGTTSP